MPLPPSLARAVDTALDRLVVPGYTSIGLSVRERLGTWPADPQPGALAGRQVVVTGGSSGLGAQCAADLVALGAHAHVVVRDEDKGRHALTELGVLDACTLWRCDLGDLDDVRDLAGRMVAERLLLRGIVHNAGVMPPERTESAQGHELSMSLHVLGPVLLTELLLPSLEDGARLVLVTSGGMYAQQLRADDLEYRQGEYSPSTAYARSKRAQVELLPALTRRWPGVAVHAMHPGWAATPGVTDSLPTFAKVMGPVLRDASGGADTSVWLMATEPGPDGGRLWQDRRARPTTWFGLRESDDPARARLLSWVLEATGLPERR